MDDRLRASEEDVARGLSVAPVPDSAVEVLSFVEACLSEGAIPMAAVTKALIATDEIYSNMVKFSGASKAYIECVCSKDGVTLSFRDDGVPFNPLQVSHPDVSLSAEERPIGGLGLLMVRKMTDEVAYEHQNGENVFTMRVAV